MEILDFRKVIVGIKRTFKDRWDKEKVSFSWQKIPISDQDIRIPAKKGEKIEHFKPLISDPENMQLEVILSDGTIQPVIKTEERKISDEYYIIEAVYDKDSCVQFNPATGEAGGGLYNENKPIVVRPKGCDLFDDFFVALKLEAEARKLRECLTEDYVFSKLKKD